MRYLCFLNNNVRDIETYQERERRRGLWFYLKRVVFRSMNHENDLSLSRSLLRTYVNQRYRFDLNCIYSRSWCNFLYCFNQSETWKKKKKKGTTSYTFSNLFFDIVYYIWSDVTTIKPCKTKLSISSRKKKK